MSFFLWTAIATFAPSVLVLLAGVPIIAWRAWRKQRPVAICVARFLVSAVIAVLAAAVAAVVAVQIALLYTEVLPAQVAMHFPLWLAFAVCLALIGCSLHLARPVKNTA